MKISLILKHYESYCLHDVININYVGDTIIFTTADAKQLHIVK